MADEENRTSHLSRAGLVAIAVLLVFLAASVWYAAKVWGAMAGVPMSSFGWLFLVLGIIVTAGLGVGLMALVFYSSRHDLDR